MPNSELPLRIVEQASPVESSQLGMFEATMNTLTPEVAEQKALEEVFENAINAEENDPQRKENLQATADIIRWTIWGEVGSPLPRGLSVNTGGGLPTLEPAFPLSRHEYDTSMDIFDSYGYSNAFPSKPRVASEKRDLLDAQLHEMEYHSNSMSYLRELQAVEVGQTPVYDAFQDQTRQAMARDTIRTRYGQDVYAPRVDSESAADWANAKAAFSRTLFYEDAPQKLVAQDTYSIAGTTEKLVTFLRSQHSEADTIISNAYNAYDLPDHLNNEKAQQARIALNKLVLGALKTLDGPFSLPAATATFLDVTATLLLKGRQKHFQYGGVGTEDLRRAPTWETFVDWRLSEYQKALCPHYGDVLSGLDAHYGDSHASLLALRQPYIPTEKRPELVTRPVGPAEKAFLTWSDYSLADKHTNVMFLSKAHQEKQEQSFVATVVECVRPRWPVARRLLQGRIAYPNETIPTHSDEADIALFVSQENLVGDGMSPSIAGFELIAADRAKNRYYFKYNQAHDPHAKDIDLMDTEKTEIAKAAHSIGMFDLAKDIAGQKDLTVRQLSQLIQGYSYHGFPDKQLIDDDQMLVADAHTLDDLRKFVTPQGLYCGQCSGGARLFQLLLTKGHQSWSRSTKAMIGLVWDGGSEMITTGAHQQTKVGNIIVDTSLTPKERKQFPLRASKNAQGIVLGTSGSELGLAASQNVGIALETRETFGARIATRLFRAADPAAIVHTSFISEPELVTPGESEPSDGTTEILQSRQRAVSRTDRILAELAVEQLNGVSRAEVAAAISLGQQALYAAHIAVSNTIVHLGQKAGDTEGNGSVTGLGALQELLPERREFGKKHQTYAYGRTAEITLKRQAKISSPEEAQVLERAAHILHLLRAADVS